MIPVLAHTGHWLAELLYVAPVIVIVTWISVKAIIDRRRPPEPGEGDQPARAGGCRGPAPRA